MPRSSFGPSLGMSSLTAIYICLAALAPQPPESLKMNYYFADKLAGSESWTIQEDGAFESTGMMEVAGQKVSSKMTGRFDGGKVARYRQELIANGTPIEVAWDGKKVTAKVSGKDQPERAFEHAPAGGFSNTHLQLIRGLVAAYDLTSGGRQPVDVLAPENGVVMKANLTRLGASSVPIKGKPVSVTRWALELGTSQLQVASGENHVILGVQLPIQFFKATVEGYEEVFVDPTTRYPELSQPTVPRTRVEKGVKLKMRDGTTLVAEVVRPEGDAKYPTILSRTPYGRAGFALVGEWWAKRGYAVVSQDCRGRGDSEGDWVPFEQERKDGFDTVQWIAAQPWSDGNVGMIGGSYGGLVQWAAAVEQPPALKCIIPQVSPPTAFFNIPYDHGVFFLYGNTWWSGIVKDKNASFSGLAIPKIDGLLTLPIDKVDDQVWGRNIPFFDSWLQRDTPKQFAGFNYQNEIERVRIPVLMISGWFDGDGIGTKLNWESQRVGGNPNRWLIYGPWTHIFNATTAIGEMDFGPDSVLDLDSVYLRFFDAYLKKKPVRWDQTPRVQAFVTGANRWRNLDDWPSPASKERTLYFSSEGPANGAASVGSLVETPASEQEPSRYTYNPANVQISEELRNPDPNQAKFYLDMKDFKDDELSFRSTPMSEPMEIGGPIRAEIFFATTAKDTDFFASIYDMDAKGRLRAIGTGGKIRAKYLSGWDNPKLLTPGRTYRATIELWDTAHRFEKGHRLVVTLSSCQFPLYARNLNTGEPYFGATRMVAAHQTIFHDAKRPSAIRFRVLP